ncbi:MAG: STM3941 family protein [Bacteroidota bacterium]
MEPIKISGSRWKQYATIIICIVFMAIGIFVPIDDPTSENILVGSLGFLFFGSLGAFLCYTLFFKPPSHLFLSSKGLEIFTFGLPPLMIKWQDIEKIDTSWMQYNHVTRIRLNSYDNILASFKPENEKKLVKLMKATRIAGMVQL